jgi:hypothetical protein
MKRNIVLILAFVFILSSCAVQTPPIIPTPAEPSETPSAEPSVQPATTPSPTPTLEPSPTVEPSPEIPEPTPTEDDPINNGTGEETNNDPIITSPSPAPSTSSPTPANPSPTVQSSPAPSPVPSPSTPPIIPREISSVSKAVKISNETQEQLWEVFGKYEFTSEDQKELERAAASDRQWWFYIPIIMKKIFNIDISLNNQTLTMAEVCVLWRAVDEAAVKRPIVVQKGSIRFASNYTNHPLASSIEYVIMRGYGNDKMFNNSFNPDATMTTYLLSVLTLQAIWDDNTISKWKVQVLDFDPADSLIGYSITYTLKDNSIRTLSIPLTISSLRSHWMFPYLMGVVYHDNITFVFTESDRNVTRDIAFRLITRFLTLDLGPNYPIME